MPQETFDAKRYIASMEYQGLAHAMQTGVKLQLERELPLNTHLDILNALKHLRVGVNMAMCEFGAIETLLVEKGIITTDELSNELLKLLRKDVNEYEARLGVKLS